MTPTTPTIPSHILLAMRLAPAQAHLAGRIIEQIEQLASTTDGGSDTATALLTALSPSQLRGLVNAFAPGPDRQTFVARRQALAYFLAWRHHRTTHTDGSPASWAAVADQLATALAALEEACKNYVADVKEQQPLYWEQHPRLLKTVRQQIIISTLETFLYQLVRQLMSGRALTQLSPTDIPLSPTTMEGDSHDSSAT